jgi:hypothetical protein
MHQPLPCFEVSLYPAEPNLHQASLCPVARSTILPTSSGTIVGKHRTQLKGGGHTLQTNNI